MSFSRFWRGCALAVILLLAACGPSLTPQAQPTPVVFAIQHTPALSTLRGDMNACMGALPGAGLVVEERSAPSLAPGEAAAALRWDAPGTLPAFSAVIGEEALVIVAHPENPRDAISPADLQALYTGVLTAWPGAEQPAAPYAYPAGDDVQRVFEALILGGATVPDRITYTAPDPAAVIEAVAADPNAVGFIPRRWLTEQVKELAVDGIGSEQMTRPLLALAESEPTGPARDWLLCLQERLK